MAIAPRDASLIRNKVEILPQVTVYYGSVTGVLSELYIMVLGPFALSGIMAVTGDYGKSHGIW
jgi:hypothetical protein